jgi:phage tail sheath protein FI
MCILDPPLGLTPTEVVQFKTASGPYSSDRVALDSNRAAMYWPWPMAYDAFDSVTVPLPPSAAAIRTYIYNDTVAQLWFAPLGVNRGLVPEAVGMEYSVTSGDKDYLYENGINPIMNYHNFGVTIMGEKTLQVLPTALDRVNVRRMLDYLHKVVVTTTFGLIGEPNDSRLWRRMVGLLQPTLQYLQDQEGVTAFQIVCDASTNPQNLVNAHEVHCLIGILPTPDAEFIYTEFVIVDSIATFNTYLANSTQ